MTEDTQQPGKYRIFEEIGKGDFATVYRALDTTLDREVALKVLDPLRGLGPRNTRKDTKCAKGFSWLSRSFAAFVIQTAGEMNH